MSRAWIDSFKNWRLHLAIGALVILGILGATYAVIVNSEAYELAKRFVRDNAGVKETVGPVTSTRLGIDYLRFKFSGTYDEMRFSMYVTGETDSAKVVFQVSRPRDAWQIDEATLHTKNGKQVPLARPAETGTK